MKRLLIATTAAAALLGSAAVAAKDMLVIDNVQEPATLDPHRQWNPDSYTVYRNIYDNLVTRDSNGAIVPQVATSWAAASDTEMDFQLRDDITFHDGTALTAEDVVFSVKRITNRSSRVRSSASSPRSSGPRRPGPTACG